MNYLLEFNTLVTILFFVVGVLFGSFGNVLIYRLPEGKIPNGRSRCRHCDHVLGVLDLIPIISFAARLARCAYCKQKISWQYPVIELLSGLLFLVALHVTQYYLVGALFLALCLWLLLIISTIDFKVQGIPDLLSFPFIALSFAYSLFMGSFDPVALSLGVAFLGGQWLVSRGTWVGSGDIILIVGIGALVGQWQLMLVCMFLAYIFGSMYAAFLLIRHQGNTKKTLAFGPFLSFALLVTLLFGIRILRDIYYVSI